VNQKKYIRFNPLSITDPKVVNYVCDDVTWALRLDQDRRPKVLAEREFIYKLEKEIATILVDMADVGIAVDWDGINAGLAQYDYFYQQMENLTRKKFEEATGRDLTTLNFRSTQQMSTLLFDPDEGLGLKAAQKTKKGGKPSTSDTSLEALKNEHPAVAQLLKYRQTKMMGNWFSLWSKLNTSYDGRVHPNFKQTTVQSGRFACDAPNVQNIRKKWWFTIVERNYEIFPKGKNGDANFEKYVRDNGTNGVDYWYGNARDYIVASPGYHILSFDYGQQELRVLAGLAKEPYLLQAFDKGEDIHKATAALMFNVPLEEVTEEQRQKGKTINFGNVYGQGAKAMGDQLGITETEAQGLFDRYFSAFSKVADWFETVKRQGAKDGYVESFMKRKSTIWEAQSEYRTIRNKAERMFVNVPVQGGGADITKVAMVKAKRMLIEKGWWKTKVRLLMNQHDSLVFEVSDDLDLYEVRDLLKPQVSFPVTGFPEFVVDWECGLRWGSCVKMLDKPEPSPEPVEDPAPALQELHNLCIRFESRPTQETLKSVASVLKSSPGKSTITLVIDQDRAELKFGVALSDALCSELITVSNGECEVSMT
jgi:DNA polymerase-1